MFRINTDLSETVYDDAASVQVYGIYPFLFEQVLKALKADGKKIVYDIDDAVDLVDSSNPFFYSIKKDAFSPLQIFKHADHITVSNDALKAYARERTNALITVIPNCYDPKEWSFVRPKRDGFRIGFAGSCTHVPDLIQIIPAIANLQKDWDVKFLIMGFGPGDYDSWLTSFRFTCTPEARVQLDTLEAMLKTIHFEWIPFVDYGLYPSVLTNMALDIGICPLIDTPFNRHRSASKAMEYTLSGALSMASDIAPYNTENSSVLVTDWEKAMLHCMKNPEYMKSKHAEHLAWIQKNRNVNDQVPLLKSIYGV